MDLPFDIMDEGEQETTEVTKIYDVSGGAIRVLKVGNFAGAATTAG
jgi:hypothetical protein